MEDLQLKINPEVALVFNKYPETVRNQMLTLRKLVIKTAKEIDGIDQ